METQETVFVVDDNPGMLEAVSGYLRNFDLEVKNFESAAAFLEHYSPETPGCLVLDLRMPNMSGLELFDTLRARGIDIPVIFVSGNASIGEAVQAIKSGSMEFLEKPYDPEILLARVREALNLDRSMRLEKARKQEIQELIGRLTKREKQILSMVVEGRQSKNIADELHVSVSTVDNHRANAMKKLRVRTPAELTRIVLENSFSAGT